MASTEDSQIIKDLASAEENIPASREATPLLGNKESMQECNPTFTADVEDAVCLQKLLYSFYCGI
jgi:hypothetical protein